MKNLIFDMGGVLIRYDPEYFLTREGVLDPSDRERLMKTVFHSPEWAMMDMGSLDEAGMEPIAFAKLPSRFHDAAHSLIFDWNKPLEPVSGMADFIRDCKEKGYGIYLLSNASTMQPTYWHDIPGSEYFDGAVISAFEKCVKPQPEIFRILLDRFNLRAEDCIFIDDMQPNVVGAEAVGIKGVRFTGDTVELKETIWTLCERAGYRDEHLRESSFQAGGGAGGWKDAAHRGRLLSVEKAGNRTYRHEGG